MLKKDLVKGLVKAVTKVDATIVRVYGVSHGVGYDLNVVVNFEKGITKSFEAHAGPKSWTMPGHLRPNNSFYEYTGSNDVYRERVIEYWEHGDGLEEYYGHFLKKELKDEYASIVEF